VRLIDVADARRLALELAYKGAADSELRAALLEFVDAAENLRDAHDGECGCDRPGDPGRCVWPGPDGKLLARFDFDGEGA
jgi:hypothetical protein